MFTILDNAKHHAENIRDLNLAVVRHMAVLVIKLVLQTELPLIRHNLLYEPGLKEEINTGTWSSWLGESQK
jgi:hypothetical protein